MEEKTIMEVCEELKEKDLGFLPPVDGIKDVFLTMVIFSCL